MKVIANTDSGYLIESTKSEVKEILGAVLGSVPKDIEIGQKIPAIDYSATIRKLKSLPESYEYKNLISQAEKFNKAVKDIDAVVSKATEI